jgi:UDP-glucose 4-epimerase
MTAARTRVLVTGGAGFIGSHVADAYLARGCEVTVLDSLAGGRREQVPAGARFVHADIRSDDAARVVADGRFHIVNNHAAQIDVRASVADPRHDASVNIDGLLNLLQAALTSGVRRFIHVSSGGVIYGEPELRPTPETAPKLPHSPYGVSKLAGEQYLFAAHRTAGLDYVCLRYSNVYGPRQDPHGEAGVVAIFCNRILSGAALTIFGDGLQTRDYVFVGDVVAANMLLSDVHLAAARSLDDRGFNVATGRETTVVELAGALLREAGAAVPVQHAPERPGELRHSSLDTQRLRALGWAPAVTLDAGLGHTFRWIAAQRARELAESRAQ